MSLLKKFFKFVYLSATCLAGGGILATFLAMRLTPESLSVFSNVGLAFPIFWGLTVALFLLGVVLHAKISIYPFVIGLFSLPMLFVYCPLNLFRTNPPLEHIKILSFNVMGFNSLQKEGGKNSIIEYLKESGADILCLQEYAEGGRSSSKRLSREDILTELKSYPYSKVVAIGDKHGGNQLACFSKYPIVRTERLSYASDYNGSALFTIKKGVDTLYVLNNHLESNKLTREDKVKYEKIIGNPNKDKVRGDGLYLLRKIEEAAQLRAKQVEKIVEVVEMYNDKKLIVCGDFNDSPLSYSHYLLRRSGLSDAFTESGRGLGISYNQNRFYFRIDHILHSKRLKAYKCSVDRTIKTSDHYPVYCYLSNY